MAFISDIIALVLFVSIVGGLVYGVLYASKQIDAGVASTKQSLKAKGLDVSSKGVSMKTDKRFDRQDYLDATQRGFVNIVESSTLGKYLDTDKHPSGASRIERTSSNTSTGSDSGSKRKKVAGMFSSSSSSGIKKIPREA